MNRHLSAKLAALAVLVTVAAAWLWAHEGHAPLPTSGATVDAARGLVMLSPEARAGLGVQTAEARLVEMEARLSVPAVVVVPWQRHAHATARVGGKIAAIHVHPGQTVEAGTVLAEVQSLELDQLQLELRAAQTEQRLAAENLRQLEEAGREGAVSAQTLQDARSRQRETTNALEIARRKLLALDVAAADVERLLRDPKAAPIVTLPVKALIGGAITHADTRVGQVIEPSNHLFGINDLSTVWLQLDILERDLSRVARGQPVTVRWEGTAPTQGTVQRVGIGLDPLTRNGIAWVEVKNSAASPLLPGMIGQAEVATGAVQATAVPQSALVRQGAESYVFVREGPGQYTRQNVVVGRRQGDLVEIVQGALVPGDQVLTAGSHELASFFGMGSLRPSKEAERAMGLKEGKPQRRPVADVVTLTGQLELPPDRRAMVSTRLAGSVQRILVDRNQEVKAGEVIAEVMSLELQDLQLELLRSHLHLELLEQTMRNLKPLADQGSPAVNRRLLRETESAAQSARQRRDGLHRKLETVGLSAKQVQDVLEKRAFVAALPVRASMAGSIVGARATLGQAVKVDDPLFEIHDLSRPPLVLGHATQAQMRDVRIGQPVRVVLAGEGPPLNATVRRSGQLIEGPDRALSVWAELQPGQHEVPLRHGMLARLTLTAAVSPPVLTVPVTAILAEGTRTYVFIRQNDGTFRRAAVEAGRRDDEVVEIVRGLEEQDTIAVAGVAGLQTAYASIR